MRTRTEPEHAHDALVPRERLESLLAAVSTIGSDLDLQGVLHRVTQAAADLADARYAALGVVAEDGTLAQFVTVGLDEPARRRIGPLPHGLGLLGELIRHPEPLRLPDLRRHPASYGFPPHHPPMTSFLGVPVRVRDRVFGNLYLTDKRSGVFDERDEALVQALAGAVGVHVENVRLMARTSRRERTAAAAAEVTTSLLSGAEPAAVLARVAECMGDLVGSDLGVIAVEHARGLLVDASWGRPPSPRGLPRPVQAALLDGGGPRLLTPDVLTGVWPGATLDAAAVVPLGAGVCLAARTAPAAPFSPDEMAELASFAGQASLAMELAQRRRDAERLSVLADRDRIARDLHDQVIQRVFATGMQLESVVRAISEPGPQERVRRAVDDLDDTIRQIRSTIYALGPVRAAAGPGLRARLLESVDAAEDALGFPPAVRLSGLLDAVPEELSEHVVSVLREGLSNAARHAHASHVEVDVTAFDEVVVRVVDDGVGVPSSGRRSGLANLEERAHLAAGSCEVRHRPNGGTELLWRAPIRD